MFVLDMESNPHPRMLAGALSARRAARDQGGPYTLIWTGYLSAMADATGCNVADLVAWVDRHDRDLPRDRVRPDGS